jgi:phage host-nuclease inhibitor protein Gam
MNHIEVFDKPVKDYADAREALAFELAAMNGEIEAVKRGFVPKIKRLFAKMADKKSELAGVIAANKELFDKPKTQVMHGIKIGYRKKTGETIILSQEQTIALIRKKFSKEQAKLMIQTKESVIKDALKSLTAADLKAIGVEIKADVDELVISATDGEIDKIIAAMEKELDNDIEQEADTSASPPAYAEDRLGDRGGAHE